MPVVARSKLTLGVGAALLAATAAGRVHAQPAARLRGVVFDSVARAPLADAAVRVFRSNQAADGFDARTDSQGGFSVPALPAGTWLVSFLHPRLDSLRIEAPLAQVQVVEAGTITLTLAIPGAATLARRLCGVPPEDSLAVVTGDVRDATQRRPVVGAMVRASWPEWVFANKKMGREDAVREARADSTGQFVLCHVPQNSIVTALAYLGADTTGVIELSVPTAEYVVADFVLDRTATGAPTRERRGAGTVRGVVTTANGQPLVNAVARVLGSGSPARSDSAGRFRVADAVAGTQTLEVRSVGFEPQRIPVVLRAGEVANVAIALAPSGTRIDTVRVTAGRVVPWQVERIEARWKQGLGVIMDGATIRERTSTTLTTALWNVPGVRLGNRLGSGNTIIMRGQNGRECFPRIFLDGYSISRGITATTARNPNLDGFVELSLDEIVTPGDVLAMEVYDNPMKVPPEFFSGGDCGVVLVWTGYALKKVAPIDPRRRQ